MSTKGAYTLRDQAEWQRVSYRPTPVEGHTLPEALFCVVGRASAGGRWLP